MVDYRRTLLRQRGEAGLQLHPFRKTQVALRNTTLNSPPPMVGKPRQAAIPITERTHDRIHTLPHTHLHAYSHSLIALLYISMSIPSELVELQLIDTQGKATTFYTYDGYYSPEDRAKISQYRKEVNKRTYTGAFIVGLAAYYVHLMLCRPPARPTWLISLAAPTESERGDCSLVWPASLAACYC
jgi:hypothetical protein